eukprot:5926225-Alexandrium_andersonii.AAC.1
MRPPRPRHRRPRRESSPSTSPRPTRPGTPSSTRWPARQWRQPPCATSTIGLPPSALPIPRCSLFALSTRALPSGLAAMVRRAGSRRATGHSWGN